MRLPGSKGAAPSTLAPERTLAGMGTTASRWRVAWFARAAAATGNAMGSAWAFLAAAAIVVVWAITGPLFHFSDTWQLVINTGTSVATFLMVFLIQNMQNRDAKAIHLKLDELLRAVHEARNDIISVEEEADEHLEHLQQQFREVRQPGTGVPAPPAPAQPPAAPAPTTAHASLARPTKPAPAAQSMPEAGSPPTSATGG